MLSEREIALTLRISRKCVSRVLSKFRFSVLKIMSEIEAGQDEVAAAIIDLFQLEHMKHEQQKKQKVTHEKVDRGKESGGK